MTTTVDRAEINRRNAARSTGPRTPEGKQRSRFNALSTASAPRSPSCRARTPMPSAAASTPGPTPWRPSTKSSGSWSSRRRRPRGRSSGPTGSRLAAWPPRSTTPRPTAWMPAAPRPTGWAGCCSAATAGPPTPPSPGRSSRSWPPGSRTGPPTRPGSPSGRSSDAWRRPPRGAPGCSALGRAPRPARAGPGLERGPVRRGRPALGAAAAEPGSRAMGRPQDEPVFRGRRRARSPAATRSSTRSSRRRWMRRSPRRSRRRIAASCSGSWWTCRRPTRPGSGRRCWEWSSGRAGD